MVKRAESLLPGTDKCTAEEGKEEGERIGEKRGEEGEELKTKKKKQHSKRLNETRRMDTVHPRYIISYIKLYSFLFNPSLLLLLLPMHLTLKLFTLEYDATSA